MTCCKLVFVILGLWISKVHTNSSTSSSTTSHPTTTTPSSSTDGTSFQDIATTPSSSTDDTSFQDTATTSSSSTDDTSFQDTATTPSSSTDDTSFQYTTTTSSSTTDDTSLQVTTTTPSSSTDDTSFQYTTTSAAISNNTTTAITTAVPTDTTSIQPSSTTALPAVYVIPPEDFHIPVEFQIKYNTTFDPQLNNETSDVYNNTASNYTDQLTQAFNVVKGFQEIVITGFWSGSLGVNFTLVISYQDSNGSIVRPDLLRDDLNNLVYPHLISSLIDQDFLNATFSGSVERAVEAMNNICIAAEQPCPRNYNCRLNSTNSKPFCEYKCHGDICGQDERCELDPQDNPVCQTETTESSTGTPSLDTSTKPTFQLNTQRTVPTPYTPTITIGLEIPFSVKFNRIYEEQMSNKSSEIYNETASNYTKELTAAYGNVTGFHKVIIHNFWNGSLMVNFTVVVNYSNSFTIEQLKEQMLNVVKPALEVAGADKSFLDEFFVKSLDAAVKSLEDMCKSDWKNICENDYACHVEDNGQVSCEHLCTDFDERGKCQNGGHCVLDIDHTAKCRCPSDDNFVYGGDSCEMKAERLALSKDYIIAIAVGSGGGVILIFIIIIIIIVRKKKSGKQSGTQKIKDSASEQSFKSMKDSEDGLHDVLIGRGNAARLDYNNPTFNLPAERLESLGLNPQTSVHNSRAPPSDPLNLSNLDDRHSGAKHGRGVDMSRQSRSGSGVDSIQRHEAPSRDRNPVQYPQFQQYSSSSDYIQIDDNESVSTLYQPTRSMQPLSEYHHRNERPHSGEVNVYDYTRRAASVESSSSRPHSGGAFYDFDYENNADRGHRIEDPYMIRRPRVSSQKRF